jgi:putative effector of murein hydrolase
MDMSLDGPPDFATMWFYIMVALAFFATALILTWRRRCRGVRPGLGVVVLLVLCALAVYLAYEAYLPHSRTIWY